MFISPFLSLWCRIQFDGENHSEVLQALCQWWLFIRFRELTEPVRWLSKRQETTVCDKDTLLYRFGWFCKHTLFVCMAVNWLVRHENIFVKHCVIENNDWLGKFRRTKEFTNRYSGSRLWACDTRSSFTVFTLSGSCPLLLSLYSCTLIPWFQTLSLILPK